MSVFEGPTMDEAAYDRTTVGDSDHREFADDSVAWASGPDGIPIPMTEQAGTVAPLHPSTFVCMEDRASFVIRDEEGDVVAEFKPTDVYRREDGSWYTHSSTVYDALRPASLPLSLVAVELFYELTCPSPLDATVRYLLRRARSTPRVIESRVDVEPIRPKCAHYWRYKVDMTGQTEHQDIERVCSAQRDDQGLLLSVRNLRLHACELRSPRHMPTEGQLDTFDAKLVELGLERVKRETETFDVEQALQEAEKGK